METKLQTSITRCEVALASYFQRKHCVLTGTGTTALRIAYMLTDRSRPKVLLPAIVCLTPMLGVHYADRIPVFADIREDDVTIDPAIVEKMLAGDPDIGCVLAVHLYGFPASAKELRDICRRHRVLFIEDLAQAMGGRNDDGSLFGTAGDCSVVSFGHTKILDVGGGGALLIDDDDLAERARKIADNLRPAPANIQQLSNCYRQLYYNTWESVRSFDRAFELFDQFPSMFERLHVYRIEDVQAGAVLDALPRIADELAHRRRISTVYQQELADDPNCRLFQRTELVAPWRFTFRLDSAVRDELVRGVRDKGYDISTWYPCLTEWTQSGREQGKSRFPVANRLQNEIVNLWVDMDYPEEKARTLAETIHDELKTRKMEQ